MSFIIIGGMPYPILDIENREVSMNCEACKFAENGVCQKEPKPIPNLDGRCPLFIKVRMK